MRVHVVPEEARNQFRLAPHDEPGPLLSGRPSLQGSETSRFGLLLTDLPAHREGAQGLSGASWPMSSMAVHLLLRVGNAGTGPGKWCVAAESAAERAFTEYSLPIHELLHRFPLAQQRLVLAAA